MTDIRIIFSIVLTILLAFGLVAAKAFQFSYWWIIVPGIVLVAVFMFLLAVMEGSGVP